LFIQTLSVIAAWVLAIVGTVLLIKIIGAFMKIRVDESDEIAGVDISEHGERAYGQSFVAGNPLFGNKE
jgi:ammonium transporter, Amt family